MRWMKVGFVIFALLISQIACQTPSFPWLDVEIDVPTIEVGETQTQQETVSLVGAESIAVNILFGAGELDVNAGFSDQLFSGDFRYNVEQWKPKTTYKEGILTVEQGGLDQDWGIPTGNTYNEWKLRLPPGVLFEMSFDVGAGEGELDFTGLQLTELSLDLGAGDYEIQFNQPNEAEMNNFSLNAGASNLDVRGIGYAGPKEMEVQGGVGNVILDFTGTWPHSADVDVTAGIGSITMRLPDDVGVQVEVKGGLSGVNAPSFEQEDDTYTNDAFGAAETELCIRVATGVGSLRLVEVNNEND